LAKFLPQKAIASSLVTVPSLLPSILSKNALSIALSFSLIFTSDTLYSLRSPRARQPAARRGGAP
jgi:hypothetical protein